MVPKIKVCGMRDAENVELLSALMPDFMGFIFYEKSPRYVTKIDKGVFRSVPEEIQKVAVFVNSNLETMLRVCDETGIDMLQLHGSESPGTCEILCNRGLKLIKAIPGDVDVLQEQINAYSYSCDYLLFDTPTIEYGGSGRKFDWQILENLEIDMPFFLSGGIGPGDEKELKNMKHEKFFAVDLNSRFEIDPAKKDIEKLDLFIKNFRDE